MCMSDETDTRVSGIHVKKDDGHRKFGVSRLETRNFRNRNDELAILCWTIRSGITQRGIHINMHNIRLLDWDWSSTINTATNDKRESFEDAHKEWETELLISYPPHCQCPPFLHAHTVRSITRCLDAISELFSVVLNIPAACSSIGNNSTPVDRPLRALIILILFTDSGMLVHTLDARDDILGGLCRGCCERYFS